MLSGIRTKSRSYITHVIQSAYNVNLGNKKLGMYWQNNYKTQMLHDTDS